VNHWTQYVEALPKFEETWETSLRLRTDTAKSMLTEPDQWKVCDCCFFAAQHKHRICPKCHAYQFIQDPEIIQFLAVTTKLTRPMLSEIVTPIRYGKEHQ
jgi:uncharacterized paraquat-inducible protein A